jgi:S1-C subfamily serine protease
MLLSQIAYRTFFIRGTQYGTGFTIDINGSEYFVTARHLIPSDQQEFTLQIMKDRKWSTIRVRIINSGKGEVDIAVLKAEEQLSPKHLQVEVGIAGLTLGQDVFFAGFPYKMWGDFGGLMNGWPTPFVKKGTISSWSISSPHSIYVDAINNEGFSGGPLYFSPPSEPLNVRIVGIVSKYRTESEYVLDENGEETKHSVSLNTGFLIAYSIEHVLQMVSASAV